VKSFTAFLCFAQLCNYLFARFVQLVCLLWLFSVWYNGTMQCLAPHNLQYASASIWCPFLVACDFTQCSSWYRITCYSQLSQGICMINKYKLLVEIVSLCCNLQGFSLHLSCRNTTLVQASWCEKFYIAMSLGKGTAAGRNLNVLRKPYDLEQHFAGCANHLT